MKTVLISGGAGGIGGAVALEAAAAGWGVWIGYRSSAERANALVKQIRKNGGQAWSLTLPLQDAAAIGPALEVIEKSGAPLPNALVLSASPAPELESFLKTTPDALANQFQVNVVGNHRLIAEAWKRFFRQDKAGHVVAILSAAMESPPWPHMSSYVIAKRGLLQTLECALAELGSAGLKASALLPGYTDTPMWKTVHPHIVESARAKTPFISPVVVARRVVALLGAAPADDAVRIETLSSSGEPRP